MTGALARRREAQDKLRAEHLARLDLVLYEDLPPVLESRPAVFRNGELIQAASSNIAARLIPDRKLRLITLTGLGDAIWTRGVARETLAAGLEVYLDTPFEWVFWDFEGAKGFQFWREPPVRYGTRTATYLGTDMGDNTVYGAMCQRCKVPKGDFRLALKPEWEAAAGKVLADLQPAKPVMIYRPLMRNPGRKSVTSRNPDHGAYAAIFKAIRDRFHVISVAGGAGEAIVHADQADTTFHAGELPITTVAALMRKAAVVYTNPGMALVMAASLGTPVIGVFGGYEDAHNYQDTVVYGPSLLLDPIKPCRCMADNHACDKRIDLPAAIRRANDFCEEACLQH